MSPPRHWIPVALSLVVLAAPFVARGQESPFELQPEMEVPAGPYPDDPLLDWTGSSFRLVWKEGRPSRVVTTRIDPSGSFEEEASYLTAEDCAYPYDLACDGADRCVFTCAGEVPGTPELFELVFLEAGSVAWQRQFEGLTANVAWIDGRFIVAADGPDWFQAIYLDPADPESAETVLLNPSSANDQTKSECEPLADGGSIFVLCDAAPWHHVFGFTITADQEVVLEPIFGQASHFFLPAVQDDDSWLAAWVGFENRWEARLSIGFLTKEGLVEESTIERIVRDAAMVRHGDQVALSFLEWETVEDPGPYSLFLSDLVGTTPTEPRLVADEVANYGRGSQFALAASADGHTVAIAYVRRAAEDRERLFLRLARGALVSHGEPCHEDGACTTGHCVDGLCCDSTCDERCHACDLAEHEGSCRAEPLPAAGVCDEPDAVTYGCGCRASNGGSLDGGSLLLLPLLVARRLRPRRKAALVIPPPPASDPALPPAIDAEARSSGGKRSRYWRWAELLRRTFGIDPELCDRCRGSMKIVALVTEPDTIARYLRYIGEPIDPPPLSPARGPPYYQSRVLRRRPSTQQTEMFDA